MHYRMFITFNKEHAENSEQAREYAFSQLSEDDSFCGEGGRFGSPLADWFVIGGRWSGELSRNTVWGERLNRKIENMEKEAGVNIWGTFYGDSEKTKIQQELKDKVEKLYQQEIPERYRGKIMYDRDTYENTGFEDDAMIVNKRLYDSLLKEHEGTITSEEFGDLDYDELSPDFIGKKWVVVVDYHN